MQSVVDALSGIQIARGSAHIYRGRTHISPWTDSHFTVDGLTFHRFLLGNHLGCFLLTLLSVVGEYLGDSLGEFPVRYSSNSIKPV